MTTRVYFEILIGTLLLTFIACNGVAAAPPLSPQAQSVRVEERDPPADATPLGPIQVTHGQGCSFSGDSGTLEGATALLRQAALQRGANYVKVTQVTEPYSGHDCYHREFKLAGLSYRLAGTAIAVAPSAAPTVPPTAVCNPICSPGYACEAGECRPLCNPACSEGQICRIDRVCAPASATPATPATP